MVMQIFMQMRHTNIDIPPLDEAKSSFISTFIFFVDCGRLPLLLPSIHSLFLILDNKIMALNIEPAAAKFAASGGAATHHIVNLTEARLGFKVKSSNNEHYRVKPVYGFVPPQGKTPFEIIRLNGPPKDDKLVVQWAEVPADEEDPQAPFKAGAQAGEVILPVKSE